MQMVIAGDFYIGVDEEKGKMVLVPVQTVSLFFSNYASEHVLEVGTEHYREMEAWYRDTRCYCNWSGLNRLGIVITDPHEVIKCYRRDVPLSLGEAREEGLQSPYAQALGQCFVARLSDGSYDWFPTAGPPFRRKGRWDRDAQLVERWSRGKGNTWVLEYESPLAPFDEALAEFLQHDYGDGPGASFASAVLLASRMVHATWLSDPDRQGWQYGAPGRAHYLNLSVTDQGKVTEWSVSTTGFPDTPIALVIPILEEKVWDKLRGSFLLAGHEAKCAGEALPEEWRETRLLQGHPSYAALKEQMWQQLREKEEPIAAIRRTWSQETKA